MQPIYKRASVLVGFVVLILVLIANSWYIKRELDSQVADHKLLSRTKQVILELTETGLLLDDAETGQRGFLYTGRPAYLTPYDLATKQIDRHLQTLTRLTADNPKQQRSLAELTQLAHTKLDELRETISLYNEGKPKEAEDLVLSDKGKGVMDEIRQAIANMEQEESVLEARRAAAYLNGVWWTRTSIFLTTALAVLWFGLVGLLHFARDGPARAPRRPNAGGRGMVPGDAHQYRRCGDRGRPARRCNLSQPGGRATDRLQCVWSKRKPITEIFPIFNEHTHEPVENPVEKVMVQGKVVGLANHTVLRHRNGTLTPIEDSAAPIRDDREQTYRSGARFPRCHRR